MGLPVCNQGQVRGLGVLGSWPVGGCSACGHRLGWEGLWGRGSITLFGGLSEKITRKSPTAMAPWLEVLLSQEGNLPSISSSVFLTYNVTTHHLEVCHWYHITRVKVPKSVNN